MYTANSIQTIKFRLVNYTTQYSKVKSKCLFVFMHIFNNINNVINKLDL